jgi:hypothetical protein
MPRVGSVNVDHMAKLTDALNCLMFACVCSRVLHVLKERETEKLEGLVGGYTQDRTLGNLDEVRDVSLSSLHLWKRRDHSPPRIISRHNANSPIFRHLTPR